ncbi:MAG: hypothetical protein M3Y77_17925 [Actinomycetota bacterium]|nr:hypothetical protein [Actinomycetota bacterium]
MTSAVSAADDDATQQPAPPGRSRVVARLRKFPTGHNGVAVIERLGADRARIVLIGSDGSFGDVVVDSVEAAEEACRLAGIDVGSWDRETAAKLVTNRGDRTKMAGTGR